MAGAAKDDVVSGDRIAGSTLDVAQRSFELLVCEGFDLAAVVADEVMVMFTVCVDRFEA